MSVHHLKVTNSPPSFIELNPQIRETSAAHASGSGVVKTKLRISPSSSPLQKKALLTIRSVQLRDHGHHHKQKPNIKNMNCKLTKGRSLARSLLAHDPPLLHPQTLCQAAKRTQVWFNPELKEAPGGFLFWQRGFC